MMPFAAAHESLPGSYSSKWAPQHLKFLARVASEGRAGEF
jgi:hypothetical protein